MNGGANTLAQALLDYRENHTAEEMKAFIDKLLVYDNAGQDDATRKQLHLILEVRDNHPEVSLVDYRRLVIDVD